MHGLITEIKWRSVIDGLRVVVYSFCDCEGPQHQRGPMRERESARATKNDDVENDGIRVIRGPWTVLAQDGSQALSRKWLAKMPEVVRGDAEMVREELRRDGVALQYASEEGRVESVSQGILHPLDIHTDQNQDPSTGHQLSPCGFSKPLYIEQTWGVGGPGRALRVQDLTQ